MFLKNIINYIHPSFNVLTMTIYITHLINVSYVSQSVHLQSFIHPICSSCLPS